MTLKCPKCSLAGDINSLFFNKGELIMEMCGHTFEIEYLGHYDESNKREAHYVG